MPDTPRIITIACKKHTTRKSSNTDSNTKDAKAGSRITMEPPQRPLEAVVLIRKHSSPCPLSSSPEPAPVQSQRQAQSPAPVKAIEKNLWREAWINSGKKGSLNDFVIKSRPVIQNTNGGTSSGNNLQNLSRLIC